MPAIQDLLPTNRLVAIRNHSTTPGYNQKVETAIADLKTFQTHPGVNPDVPMTAWGSYGKDSMAMWLLCELADVPYQAAFIYNELELPQHYPIVEEFDNWLGQGAAITYSTEYRGIDYLDISLWYCRKQRQEKGITGKPPITFFDPQEAYDLFYDHVIGDFHHEHIAGQPNTLQLWSTRASEGMGRQWELSKSGKLFQPSLSLKKGETPIWRGLPIGDWSDLDVWAFLMEMQTPVSAVYGMNEISQRGKGRNYHARTLWYCDPHVFSIPYVKWLKKYAPKCLMDVMERFPEVRDKLKSKAAA